MAPECVSKNWVKDAIYGYVNSKGGIVWEMEGN